MTVVLAKDMPHSQNKWNTILHQKQSICPGVNPKLVGCRTEGKSSMQKPIPLNQTRNGINFPCV